MGSSVWHFGYVCFKRVKYTLSDPFFYSKFMNHCYMLCVRSSPIMGVLAIEWNTYLCTCVLGTEWYLYTYVFWALNGIHIFPSP